jgi:hypothetical protein
MHRLCAKLLNASGFAEASSRARQCFVSATSSLSAGYQRLTVLGASSAASRAAARLWEVVGGLAYRVHDLGRLCAYAQLHLGSSPIEVVVARVPSGQLLFL